VLESRNTPFSGLLIVAILQEKDKYVKLMSMEGVTFLVEKKAANVSITIKQMLSSDGSALTYCPCLHTAAAVLQTEVKVCTNPKWLATSLPVIPNIPAPTQGL